MRSNVAIFLFSCYEKKESEIEGEREKGKKSQIKFYLLWKQQSCSQVSWAESANLCVYLCDLELRFSLECDFFPSDVSILTHAISHCHILWL